MLRGFACLLLLCAACSNDPVDKTPNNSANGQTNGPNGTVGPNNANIGPNLGSGCQNNTPPPMCQPGFLLVSECPDGVECVTRTSCGAEFLCARTLTPTSWADTCGNAPGCMPLAACDVDEDCTLVAGGNVCGCDQCPAEAIGVSDEAAYSEALMAARDACESLEECTPEPCVSKLPHCDLQTGVCVARDAKYITTEGLPNDCELASDCVAVFQGEVCDVCMCPNTAIAQGQLETYQMAFDVDCAHDVACDCAGIEVTCDQGACVVAAP